MNKQYKICQNITKLNQEEQNQRLRVLARVEHNIKLKIIQHQKALFHKLKNIYNSVDNTTLTLASLILAIDTAVKQIDNIHFNTLKLRAKNEKGKAKREKLLSYWAIVRTLKLEHKMSFRNIATYFAKYHKLEVSYSTIFSMWNELENNNIQIKEN